MDTDGHGRDGRGDREHDSDSAGDGTGARFSTVRTVDPEVADALAGERRRQNDGLQMIASENHASSAVLEAQGSHLTNKYAEGYPGERYYAGCEHADRVEQLAIDRAKELFGAEHVNVQPHSGTQANQAVYFAVLEPGDRILSLSLDHGGHLSHGHPANFTGQLYEVDNYHVDPETGRIDYDALRERAEAFDPDVVVSGFSAYPRAVDFERVQAAADAVDAHHVADIAHITGLVAAGVHPSPVGVADFVTGSTHKTIRSGRGGIVMCGAEHADDVDAAVFPGGQGGPLMHNVAGKAVGFREALEPDFREYAERVVENARALADRLQDHGLHPVSGGTDTHIVLVDLRESHPAVTGAAAEDALSSVGVVCNKNTVPGEQRSPFVTSGIRLGTAALTTRGFETEDLRTVADCVARVVDAVDGDESEDEDDDLPADVREDVSETVDRLCAEYPAYDE